MGRQLLRTPELAERFVVETLALLERQGPEAITTRAAASAAGSSLAALNQLFGGRSGLLDAVALRGFSILLDELNEAVASGDPKTSLIELCSAHRKFGRERPRLLDHMYSRPHGEFDPGPDDNEIARAVRRLFTSRFASLLDRPRNDTAVVDAAVGLIALLEGLTRQERAGILGSTSRSTAKRWLSVIELYLEGAAPDTT